MKIKPQPGIVYLKVEEAKAGALNVSGRMSAVECAEVIEVGDDIKSVKKGDKVFVKSWAVDTITYKNESYRFCALETNGVLAVVK